jgi:uncharacterized membrane protein
MKTNFFAKTLGSLSVVCVSLFAFPQVSEASLRFCNNTSRTIDLAFGYPEQMQGGSSTRWTSKGWYNIDPSECATVISERLQSRYYYFYAEDFSNGVWKGNHNFCTTSEAFTIHGDQNCRSRGYDERGFRQVDTGDDLSHTVNLN